MKHITLFTLYTLATLFIASAQKLSKDQQDIKNAVTSFYKWYQKNDHTINSFKLYKGKKKKDLPPYVIDWKEVDRYFSYIRKNVPLLGEAFIENEKKFFKNAEKEFIKDPEDEIAPGFDYDRFTGSQEDPKYTVDILLDKKSTWSISVAPDGKTAKVLINHKISSDTEKFRIELDKEGSWRIAKPIEAVQ